MENGFRLLNEAFVHESLSPFELSSFIATTTSFVSPSTTNLIPMENIPHAVTSLSPPQHSSILVKEYSRQLHPK
jgi:hypothetical protein